MLWETISKIRASGFIRGSSHLETIKALGLRPRAFICFSVFGTPDETLALVGDILRPNIWVSALIKFPRRTKDLLPEKRLWNKLYKKNFGKKKLNYPEFTSLQVYKESNNYSCDQNYCPFCKSSENYLCQFPLLAACCCCFCCMTSCNCCCWSDSGFIFN